MIITGSDIKESLKAVELAKAHRESPPLSFAPLLILKLHNHNPTNYLFLSLTSRNPLRNRRRPPLRLLAVHQAPKQRPDPPRTIARPSTRLQNLQPRRRVR